MAIIWCDIWNCYELDSFAGYVEILIQTDDVLPVVA